MKQEKPDQYYEAVLQLRNNPPKEAVNCVVNAINKRKGVSIAKLSKVRGGIDIYISSQRFTRSLGKLLKKSFKGKVVESRKLYGVDRQKSRLIYRGTVLFKFD